MTNKNFVLGGAVADKVPSLSGPVGGVRGGVGGLRPPILEYTPRKVTFDFERYKNLLSKTESFGFVRAKSERCRSWVCPVCRKSKGFAVRSALISRSSLFKVPRLFTLTVDRSSFSGPSAAYDYVMGKKFIARLLTKELGIKRWVWVLEFQEKTGEGFPHWHILLDVSDLPGRWFSSDTQLSYKTRPSGVPCKYIEHFFDLAKVHRLLRAWGISKECNLSLAHGSFKSPEHAVNYITKYLVKSPRRGVPSWVLHRSNVRFYQPSHAFGSLLESGKKVSEPSGLPSPARKPKKYIDRLSGCGLSVSLLAWNTSLNRWQILERSVHCEKEVFERSADSKITLFFGARASVEKGFFNEYQYKSFRSFVDSADNEDVYFSTVQARRKFYLKQWGAA